MTSQKCAGQKDRHKIFKVMKSKDLKPRLLYPAKLSFRLEGQIKSFPDKKKLEFIITTKPVLQEMLKGKKINIMNNKMAITTCPSIITLNGNGLRVPIKKSTVAEETTKQEDPYLCCG